MLSTNTNVIRTQSALVLAGEDDDNNDTGDDIIQFHNTHTCHERHKNIVGHRRALLHITA